MNADARDQFLRSVCHELRTPIAVALTWAQLLREGPLPPERTREALDAIERSLREQQRLVDRLADVARLSGGRIDLDRQRVDLATVVREAVEGVRERASARGIAIDERIAPCGEAFIDVDRFHQAMGCLLDNAERHCLQAPGRGRITVGVERVDAGKASVTIEDDGTGIASELLPWILDPSLPARRAAMGERATGRGGPRPGLCLGLVVARCVAELHGGSLEVASDGLDRGARCRLVLPIAAPEESTDHG